ncbi:U-box domain-containing protein 20 [Salvia divinorum]|uniref:U-box domain-containing protein n=1 Tax=Salvia divinorum TaxID=28513 RepID=A0ABD1IDH1_SALDI
MSSLWRRRRKSGKSKEINSGSELTIPTHFRCPISLELMKDPVSLATGVTYDRESIDMWHDTGNTTCPVTNQVLGNSDQIPNHELRKMIQDWCVDNKSHGVERIPTPRVPLSSYQVTEVCSKIAAASRGRHDIKCRELLTKINNWAKESHRNKQCLVKNGIGAALAEAFARFSTEKYTNLLKEIMSALTWSFPLGEKGISDLKSVVSLHCMARFLKGDDLSSRRDTIFVLKEVVISSGDDDHELVEIEGIEETLFQVMKVPICPRATQACLVVIRHMMMVSQEKVTMRFVKLGLVDLVLEILVDGSKSVCEKSLVVLDVICRSGEGKESARRNALMVPILVKKILRVSDVTTELCVSSLWKVCLGGNGEGGLVEAVGVGGFQKLLLVLQLGCGEQTKEKATDLLKSMNVYKKKVECFDSSFRFNYISRPN